MDVLPYLKNLRELRLFGEKPKDFDDKKYLPQLNNILIFKGTEDYIEDVNSPENLLCGFFPPRESIKFKSNFPRKLCNAIVLNLCGCNLQPLPDLSCFTHLTELDLMDTQINTIPSSIGKLKNLRELNLRNNKIEELPTDFFNLQNLEILDISKNLFNYLPRGLFSLQKLKEIYLYGNPYKNAPHLQSADQIENGVLLNNNTTFFEVLKLWDKPLKQNNLNSNYNYFNLKIPKELRTPMLQYIEFFKDYVEATKGKEIIFEVKRDTEGLVLVTNGNTNVDLTDLGTYFQEYVNLTQQQSDDWIFNFEQPTTAMKADIFRLKMENEIGRLKNALNIAKLENAGLNNQLSDAKSEIKFLRDLSQSFVNKIQILEGDNVAKELNIDQLLLDIQD